MVDHEGGGWICTGTLIGPRTVLTAAHCLDTTMFVRYDIDARNAPTPAKVRARNPAPFGGTFENVANPDIGVLTLDKEVPLAAYGTPTDVTSLLAQGQVQGGVIRREIEGDERSPFLPTPFMPVTSAADIGYDHGHLDAKILARRRLRRGPLPCRKWRAHAQSHRGRPPTGPGARPGSADADRPGVPELVRRSEQRALIRSELFAPGESVTDTLEGRLVRLLLRR